MARVRAGRARGALLSTAMLAATWFASAAVGLTSPPRPLCYCAAVIREERTSCAPTSLSVRAPPVAHAAPAGGGAHDAARCRPELDGDVRRPAARAGSRAPTGRAATAGERAAGEGAAQAAEQRVE